MNHSGGATELSSKARVLGIDNVLVAVGDLDAAIAFYAGALAFPLRFQVAEAGIALFAIGTEEPGLLVRAGEVNRGLKASPRIWLEVRDARAAADELARRSVTPLSVPFEVHTGWAFEVADPWGNVIGFTDYTKDPARARPIEAERPDRLR